MSNVKIKRALISVTDKTNLDILAKKLIESKVEIISSGGTGKYLSELGILFTPIEKVTGNPEAFGGRMKTLSFQISSALLFRRDNSQDLIEAKENNITHYHTYPRTPKMNAHSESFNGTIQEEFVDYHVNLLFDDITGFNEKLKGYLLFYNTKRVHYAFKNKRPVLAICRGFQLANVYFGGTLYQDLKLVINTPTGHDRRTDEVRIRSLATAYGIPCVTTLPGAEASICGLEAWVQRQLGVQSIQHYHEQVLSTGASTHGQ